MLRFWPRTDAVVRYRRDLGRSSALGVLMTDAETFSFQALISQTEYPAEITAEFGQPAGSFDDQAHRLSYEHERLSQSGRTLFFKVGYA